MRYGQYSNGPYLGLIPIADIEDTCDCGLEIEKLDDRYMIVDRQDPDDYELDLEPVGLYDMIVKCKCGKIWRIIG
jgi:hypothetical protein